MPEHFRYYLVETLHYIVKLLRKLANFISFQGTTECPHCSKMLSNVYKLKKHIEVVHLKILKFKCDRCDLRFGQRIQVRLHDRVCQARSNPWSNLWRMVYCRTWALHFCWGRQGQASCFGALTFMWERLSIALIRCIFALIPVGGSCTASISYTLRARTVQNDLTVDF